MKKLELEFRNKFKPKQPVFKIGENSVIMTPKIDEDFWVFRVKLIKDQALVAFPKFRTLGIGFALESDWNTNLPYDCEPEEIYKHIRCNRRYDGIKKSDCIKAIKILKKASVYYKKHETPEVLIEKDFDQFVEYYETLKEKASQK